MTDTQAVFLGFTMVLCACFMGYQIREVGDQLALTQPTITGFMICKEPSPNTTMTCKEYEPTKY